MGGAIPKLRLRLPPSRSGLFASLRFAGMTEEAAIRITIYIFDVDTLDLFD